MSEVNPIMVQTLAKMTGKTEEEVIKFLQKEGEQLQVVPDLSKTQQVNAPNVVDPEILELAKGNAKELELVKKFSKDYKAEVAKELIEDEVITEEVPLDQLNEQQLQEAEEENNVFSDTIRVGSKIRVTWEPNVGKGKIKWVGKVGTVIQKLSDSGVSVFLVEFPAGKIPFQRVNKKTGKLEKGYHTKKLQQWLDENNIELVF